jgi:C4-dicarboxylate transporter DctM subunit
VVYAAVTNVSVGTLFLALIASGVLFGGIIMIVNYWVCKKRGYGIHEIKETFSIKKFTKYLFKAIPALIIPILILGGIFSGLFTPTEAAVVASVYAIIISLILKTLKFSEIFDLFKHVAILGGSLMLIVGTITAFKWVLAIEQIPLIIANSITTFSESRILFLIITNIIFLIAGMFESGSANVLLLVPIMYPISQVLGINPVFYGVIIIANQAIGMITPPFAITLFVSSRVCNTPFSKTVKEIIPYIICLIFGLILITFVEPISLYIPKVFGLIR